MIGSAQKEVMIYIGRLECKWLHFRYNVQDMNKGFWEHFFLILV